jgi:hypothetical protein
MTRLFEVAVCKALVDSNISCTRELDAYLDKYATVWFKEYRDQNEIASVDAMYVLIAVIFMMIKSSMTYDQFYHLLEGVNIDGEFRVKDPSLLPKALSDLSAPPQVTTDFSDVFLRRVYTYVNNLE